MARRRAVRHGCGASGFTLLELIAVIVLIGLLSAFAPVFLDSIIVERELEAEIARLGDTIEILLRQAVLDGVPYAIHYDTQGNRYAMQLPIEVVYDDPTGNTESATTLVLEEDPEDLDWRALPKGIDLQLYEGTKKIDDGRFRVELSPRGTVDPHALVMIHNDIQALNDDERARTLKVNFAGIISYLPGIRTEDFKKSEAEMGN